MSPSLLSLRAISDAELLERLRALAASDSRLEADLLVHLLELDGRELYLGLGHPSLFAYCTEVLHFSESVAYHRIAAARAARSFPRVVDLVRSGELHLSGVRLLIPHLTRENERELLSQARHKSKRAIEQMLADREPKPDVPARVRRLPERAPSMAPPAPLAERPPTRATVPGDSSRPPVHPNPLGLGRFAVAFTASSATREKLEEARSLLRHQIPDGDLGQIFDRALEALLRDVRRTKFAEVASPQSKQDRRKSASRHIPAAIKRAVAERDGGSCTFVAPDGRRCGSRDALEFHHQTPFARVPRHRAEEITLRCRAHNRHAAILDFGAEHMNRWRRTW
jgi:hypothetical protein